MPVRDTIDKIRAVLHIDGLCEMKSRYMSQSKLKSGGKVKEAL
jgi:hypothetical protein